MMLALKFKSLYIYYSQAKQDTLKRIIRDVSGVDKLRLGVAGTEIKMFIEFRNFILLLIKEDCDIPFEQCNNDLYMI